MRLHDRNGELFDATFFVDSQPLSVVYESAGGKTGVNARNRDYGRALPVLLQRLAAAGVVVVEIRVDSVVTRRLPTIDQQIHLRRHQFPIHMTAVQDFDDLKRDISTAAREPGAREGASRGGSSRRLRLVLERVASSPSELEQAIAGRGAAPEVEAVNILVDSAAGRTPGRSQGFLLSAAVKRAVEDHAMLWATAHYSQAWSVKDVHLTQSYDLRCVRGDEVLHVEVKGTTSLGEAVIVTANEVRTAHEQHPRTELFVVSGIQVKDVPPASPKAIGGVAKRYPGWGMDEKRLRPLGFIYFVGRADGDPE